MTLAGIAFTLLLTTAPAAPQAPADLGIELVAIPAGTFVMGSPADEPGRNADLLTGEGPQTTVHISKAFWMAKTKITRAQYEAIMGPTADPWNAKVAESWKKLGVAPGVFPIVNVTWDQANDYCHKLTEREHKAGRLPEGLSYALPTEAQWEYACRAGTKTRNYLADNDDALDDIAWYVKTTAPFNRSAMPRIQPVGQKKPNAWGLYDMLGNAREWVADRVGPYAGGEVTDPRGPDKPVKPNYDFRVQRGAAWIDPKTKVRCAARSWSDASFGGKDGFKEGTVGFRVVVVSE